MPDVEVIDFHTHTFPTPERGIGWQRSIGHRDTVRNGTLEELLPIMQKAGISHSVMLSYTPTRYMYDARVAREPLPSDEPAHSQADSALKAEMVKRAIDNNEWQLQQTKLHDELISFAGIEPVYSDAATMVAEIDDKVSRGARGVKIVPTALQIYGNDRRLWPAYERISQLGVPMLSQMGGRANPDGSDAWGRPGPFGEALAEFPNLTIVAAHLGQGYEDDIVDLCKRFPNFYADLSMRLHNLSDHGLTPATLVDFIRRCGAEHIIFGTNYPMCDPVQFVEVLETLPLTGEELGLIASGNAKRILKMQ